MRGLSEEGQWCNEYLRVREEYVLNSVLIKLYRDYLVFGVGLCLLPRSFLENLMRGGFFKSLLHNFINWEARFLILH